MLIEGWQKSNIILFTEMFIITDFYFLLGLLTRWVSYWTFLESFAGFLKYSNCKRQAKYNHVIVFKQIIWFEEKVKGHIGYSVRKNDGANVSGEGRWGVIIWEERGEG